MNSGGRPKTRRVVLAALGLFLVALGVTVVLRMLSRSDEGIARNPTRAGADGPAWLRGLPRVAGDPSNESQLSLPAPQRPPAANEADVCGLGRVRIDRNLELPPVLKAKVDANWQRWIERHSRSDSDRDRALSLVFKARRSETEAQEAVFRRRAAAGVTATPCEIGSECMNAAMRAGLDAAIPVLNQLVRLGTSTQDPAAYALALAYCPGASGTRINERPCALLSAERWAQLDPDNGAPWLFVMDAAAARKDWADRDEALHRLSQATRITYATDHMFRALVDAGSTFTTPEDWLTVSLDSLSLWAFPHIASYQTLAQVCLPKAPLDVVLRSRCAAASEALVAHERSLLGYSIAVSVAVRTGLSEDRARALSDEKDALMSVSGTHLNHYPMLSCDWVSTTRDYTEQVAIGGEVGALRDRIAASGRTVVEIAAEERARRRTAAAPDQAKAKDR